MEWELKVIRTVPSLKNYLYSTSHINLSSYTQYNKGVSIQGYLYIYDFLRLSILNDN